MEKDGKFVVGREGGSRGEIIDGARIAGDCRENATVGEIDGLLCDGYWRESKAGKH